MDRKNIEDVLKQASKAVEGLPENLQGEAFKMAVALLTGQSSQLPGPSASRNSEKVPHAAAGAELPDVADLLRVSRRNPDRYLVFMQELEFKGQEATSASLTEQFRIYRQDMPKLPARDLGDMV